MKEVEDKLRRGMEQNGHHRRDAGDYCSVHYFICAVWISGIACGQFCAACVCQRVFEMPLSGGVYGGDAEQSADGILSAATLVKDAQRHGLRVRPIDVTCSDWLCTLEKIDGKFAVRLGLRYVKGLRAEIGAEIVGEQSARAFTSVDDLKRRVPRIQKGELAVLAEVGALNRLGNQRGFHRRSALWQVERTARASGPLYEYSDDTEKVFAETELAQTQLDKPELGKLKRRARRLLL